MNQLASESPQQILEEQPSGSMPVNPNDLYASQIQEERIRNLISQISPENQLTGIQWRIKGYAQDPVTQVWKKIDENTEEPSPVLISNYISYLSSLLNQNTTLSNLASEEINRIMNLMIEWLVDDIDSNSEEYGLKDNYSERTRIGHIMLNNTFMCLKRAQNGMESRRIFNALDMKENLAPQQSQGLLNSLKFWQK